MLFKFCTKEKLNDSLLITRKVIGRPLTEDELKENRPRCLRPSKKEYTARLQAIQSLLSDENIYTMDVTKTWRSKTSSALHSVFYPENEELFDNILRHDYGITEYQILEFGGDGTNA